MQGNTREIEQSMNRSALSAILAEQFDHYQPEIIQLAESMLRLCDGKSFAAVKAATDIVWDFSKSACFMRLDAVETEQSMICFFHGDLELTQELWDLMYSEWISNSKKTLQDDDVRRLRAKLASRTNRGNDRDG